MRIMPRPSSGILAVFLAVVIGGWDTPALSQSPAAYGQQLYVMKSLKPGLKTVGVIGTRLSDKATQGIAQAGANQGVEVILARPKNLTEVAAMYKKLVGEKKAQIIWLPDPDDTVVLGDGFDFLRESATVDGVGIFVPTQSLVPSGALCTVQLDAGKVKAYVNQRIATAIGVSLPADATTPVLFVAQ